MEANTKREALLAANIRTTVGDLKRRLLGQSGRSDLTSAQTSVILRLERSGPAPVSTLARAEGMRPQSMSANIKALQEVGLIVSTADPADGRQRLMALSPKCRAWLEKGRATRQDWLTGAIKERLNIAEQRQLAKALELLSRLAQR